MGNTCPHNKTGICIVCFASVNTYRKKKNEGDYSGWHFEGSSLSPGRHGGGNVSSWPNCFQHQKIERSECWISRFLFICLFCFLLYSLEPQPMECWHSPLARVSPHQLTSYRKCPADTPINLSPR